MFDFKAAIFDLDGTVLDSMWVWDRIDVDFLSKRHLSVPPSYASQISSMSFRETAEYTISLFGLDETPEDVMAEWTQMSIDAYRERVKLKPGALQYLNFLIGHGIKLGVATCLSKSLYEPALANNGILEMFEAITSSDEVGCGKATPDIYLLTARKLQVAPAECIAFDDTFPAICGIKAAGMRAYGVYDELSRQDITKMKERADGFVYRLDEMMGKENDR